MALIYLDNNATTKPFPAVIEAMTQFMASRFWNVSSAYGQLDGLEEVIESAKATIRKLIGATIDDEVVFTSGATETNTWVVEEGKQRTLGGGWILSSQIEHPSVHEPLESFQKQGGDVRWVPVTRNGTFDLDQLEKIVTPDLRFASLMYAHNETGVIQPLQEAVSLIRKHAPQCLIHSDATQAIGKIPISFSIDLAGVDLISFSGHKFHGPKGIGGLVIRNGTSIQPLIRGGGQQNNLRSGTLNIPAIVGISVAAEKSWNFLQMNQDSNIRSIRNHFEKTLLSFFPDTYILGFDASRLPNTSFFGIPGADADDLVHALAANQIAVSKGSSCSDQSIEPAKSALLMSYTYEEASSLIRFSASFENTFEDVQTVVNKLYELVYG